MARKQHLPTRVLLVCAAIAVVTGAASAVAGYLSVPALTLSPLLYGLVLTAHLLPGIVAQDVLQLRWVALITHVLAALVATALSPQWVLSYLLAVVIMGGVQEGWAAVGRYRRWSTPWLLCGGLVLGVVLSGSATLAIVLARNLAPAASIAAVAITIGSAVVWTLVGVAIGQAVRRAGIVRGDRA